MIKRTKPLRRVSKKRAKQLREYAKLRIDYLAAHPICEVWLRLNGWQEIHIAVWSRVGGGPHVFAEELFRVGAPRAIEIHHMNKRRAAMILNTSYWLAVSRENHERIENNKAWARREGFLLNF